MKNPSAARVIINLGLDTLNQLLGGNSEAEVELRQTIVAQFAKRHLKGLIDDRMMAGVAAEVYEQVRREHRDLVGTYSTIARRVVPSSELTKTVREVVKKQVEDAIKETVDTAVQAALPKVSALVDKALATEVDKQVKARVAERLKQAQKALED